jgi:hypothetical protein
VLGLQIAFSSAERTEEASTMDMVCAAHSSVN